MAVSVLRRPAVSNLSRVGARRLSSAVVPLWLLGLVLGPNILLVLYSFWTSDAGRVTPTWTLENYTTLLRSETFRTLVLRTCGIALAAASVATLVAYPMAYCVARYVRRAHRVAVLMVIVPLWVSLLVRVYAWRVILGSDGLLNSLLVDAGLVEKPLQFLLYNRWAALVAFTYIAIPFVFLSSYTALEKVPAALVESSRDSGATPLRTFRTVTWPLTRGGVAIGFALAFLVVAGDFVTPAMVGGLNGTMVGTFVITQFGLVGNWSVGAAAAVLLLLFVGAILVLVFAMGRTRGVITEPGGFGYGETRRPWRYRIGGRVLLTAGYLFLYLPLVMVAVFSLNASRIQTLPLAGFTTEWYAQLATDVALGDALRRSLVVAASTVGISVVFGCLLAFALHRWSPRARALAQSLLALPVALPGIVLGLSLAATFQLGQVESELAKVVIGHATFVTPIVMMVVLARLQALDPSLAQASMDLGADGLRTFWHVQLPMIRNAVVVGALLGFTVSFDEVAITFFLVANEPTLPLYVWNQVRFGFTPAINAIFTVVAVVSLTVVVAAGVITRRASHRVERGK